MLTETFITETLTREKPFLLKEFHVEQIGYFGSYAVGKQRKDSDIDILVKLKEPLGLKFFMLQEYLEKILTAKIDLVTVKALREELRKSILSQTRYV